MAFPKTRHTLIRRLADHSSEADWQQFIADYWRPIRRFAMSYGRLQPADADDVAGSTFEILIRNRLLLRWSEEQTARLRTLLCSVVRKQLANRRRKKENRQIQLPLGIPASDDGQDLEIEVPAEERASFEGLWVDEILVRTLAAVRSSCLRDGKINQFRTLFGRVCEDMTNSEVADCLKVPLTTAEAWYQQARNRLSDALRQQVHNVVSQYADPKHYDSEFQNEWSDLADYLRNHGGLESAIRRSHNALTENIEDTRVISPSQLEMLCSLDEVSSRQP